MPAASAAKAAALPQARTRVGNGNGLFTGDIDERTTEARRYREILASIIADLGGDLSEAEMAIARRAVGFSVVTEGMEAALVSGKAVDLAAYATAANAMRRLLVTLGIRRRSKDITPTIAQFLAARATEEADEDDASEDTSADDDAPEEPALEQPDALYPAEDAAP